MNHKLYLSRSESNSARMIFLDISCAYFVLPSIHACYVANPESLRSCHCSLTDKPRIEELSYFLDFQHHRLWAPVLSDLPLGPCSNRQGASPALHFSLVGSKLYVSSSEVKNIIASLILNTSEIQQKSLTLTIWRNRNAGDCSNITGHRHEIASGGQEKQPVSKIHFQFLWYFL